MRNYVFSLLIFFCSCGVYKSPPEPLGCRCDSDSDGDGIWDCTDRCGDTPDGVAVDMHGCPKDTDGDGVADYEDYQLITPTECQPVDSMGVGYCPCPCEYDPVACNFKFNSTWIGFSHLSYKLDSTALKSIEHLAQQMKSNPNFPIQIKGYYGTGFNTSSESWQASWSRVYELRQVLINKFNVDSNRILMRPALTGPSYLVELTGLDKNDDWERIGHIVPPGFAGFKDHKNKRIYNWKQ